MESLPPKVSGKYENVVFRVYMYNNRNPFCYLVNYCVFRVPVAGIEAFERVKGKWICLKKTSDNFFSNEGEGAISFPLKIRLTSIMNEQLQATIDTLKNDVAIKSDLQFSDTVGLRGEKQK